MSSQANLVPPGPTGPSTAPLGLSPAVANAAPAGAITLDPPSARFQNELDAVLRRAADEATLRPLLIECVLNHRPLAGAAWYGFTDAGSNASPLVTRLDNPLLQQAEIRDWMAGHCRQAAESQQDVIVRSREVRNLTLVALPIGLPDGRTEAVALLVPQADPQQVDGETLAGRSLIRAAAQWHSRTELQSLSGQLRTTSALLELAGRLEAAKDLTAAARLLADSVRDYLNCQFTAVGSCRPDRSTSRLAAVAGQAEFDRNSPRARQIKAALDETLVRGELTAWPPLEDPSQQQRLAQRQLAEACRCELVISVPLRDTSGKQVGAVTVAGGDDLNRPDVRRFLQTMDVPAGGALEAVRRAQRGPLRRAAGWLLGPGRGRLLTAALLLATATLLLFLPQPYRIACRFRCEPVERRFCVAPYDGLLQQTLAEPGDLVRAGQVLARMDDREIHYEMSGLAAEQQRAAKQRDVHLANEEVPESYMAALEVDRVGSRTAMLRLRLDNLEIRSLIDGVVLSGSLDRRENYPVTIGQLLYEIAPLDPIRLEVAVPADELEHVRVGMAVELRLDSQATQVRRGKITSLRPRAEIVDDRNVFVAAVEVANTDGSLRPGMEGSARIVSDRHPLGWNLLHRAYEHAVSTLLW